MATAKLYFSALVKASVDGAVNILYTCPHLDHDIFIPDLITGDFDSALPQVIQHYKEKVSHNNFELMLDGVVTLM